VFRDHCTRYQVSRPILNHRFLRWSERVAGTEHPSRRTEQLSRPAGCSHREFRPPIRDPQLS